MPARALRLSIDLSDAAKKVRQKKMNARKGIKTNVSYPEACEALESEEDECPQGH